ncbi:hypothetical protein [Bosea sp. (in: a-proteobacteria)]|uniref:hypothetical protein n=1 Tax=Bosea sp. (in: a-proteobacteria) TaxID=1871050 RepID=UPI003B3BD38B
MSDLPQEAVGLKLFKISRRDELIACEGVRFARGRPAVDTVLRRAAISGRVEIGGKVEDHFADVLDDDGQIVETVALDARSYRALKTRWMRCNLEKRP